MSLSHCDPLANLRLFERRLLPHATEPQTNRPWAPASIFTKPKTNWF